MKIITQFILFLFLFLTSIAFSQSPVLWGMTNLGGANSGGVLFSFSAPDSVYSVHHTFGAGVDGNKPEGSLMKASNGLLYGTTARGVISTGGVLFSYNLTTGVYTILHTFDDASGTDGRYPLGTLLQANDGLLYGTTQWGGTHVKGTIYSLDPSNNNYTKLYDFGDDSTDQEFPNGGLIQASNGLLYGLMHGDGLDDYGAIFTYNINTHACTKVLDFSQHGGYHPQGSLVQAADGLLYCLTFDIMGALGSGGLGAMFSFNTTNNTIHGVHTFGNTVNSTVTDGFLPEGSLIQATDGKLYGMCGVGGAYYNYGTSISTGVIFSYDYTDPFPNNRYKLVHSFNSLNDGGNPYGSLLQASDSALYGMTYSGGANGKGTIFKFDINTGTETVVHSFSTAAGEHPTSNLIEDNAPAFTGIKPMANNTEAIRISPNPNTGSFMVSLPNQQEQSTVEVYNVLGEKIYSAVLSKTNNIIDLSNQVNGLYFVYLHNQEQTLAGKVVIER